jgi:hypothetical protein
MRIILPPLKWDKTHDGLDFRDFSRWATEYEISHLPPGTIFPRPGQIWEAIRDCEVHFQACIEWQEPLLSKVQLPGGEVVALSGSSKAALPFPFGTARLRKEERVRVLEGRDVAGKGGAKPIGVDLHPLRYEELEEGIVPVELRKTPGYAGYRLYVRTARPQICVQAEKTYLNEDFKLIQDVIEP